VNIPSFEELRQGAHDDGLPFDFLGPIRDRKQAREWGLVLSSQGIDHTMLFTLDGWALRVARADHDSARKAVRLYDEENRDWPPVDEPDVPRHRPSLAVAIAFCLLGVFFAITGPVQDHSAWFTHGRADAHLLLSEPWRMVTALTLHADSQHVLGNMISGSIFGSTVARRLGPGGALLSIASAGALGNAANALFHLRTGHLSIGASTAVFAAVGILAGIQTVRLVSRVRSQKHQPRRKKLRAIDVIAPIAGGLALLGSLGSGGAGTDLGAHGFGFLAGLLTGIGAGLVIARHGGDERPSTALQLALASAAVLLISGSWALAMLRA
jgi:membrane associated rhomboid family serine protease